MQKIKFLFCLVIVPLFMQAQTDSSATRTSTSIIFGDGAPAKAPKGAYNANALKVGIFEIFSGKYGLFYERELGSVVTLQAGGGLTGRNFVGNLIGRVRYEEGEEQESPNFPSAYDYIDDDYTFNSRKAKMGYFMHFMPKFYFADEDGMDGSYIGLTVQHVRYNYEAYGILDPTFYEFEFRNGNNISEFEKNTILGITWGNNRVNDETLLEYGVTLGVNNIKAERRDAGYLIDPFTQEMQPTLSPNTRTVKRTSIYLELSMKFGFWWD